MAKWLPLGKQENGTIEVATQHFSEKFHNQEGLYDFVLDSTHHTEMVFTIDLAGDVIKQVNNIKILATSVQNSLISNSLLHRKGRKRDTDYRLCLMAYDARMAGISTSEIAAYLHPEVPNIDPDYHARKRINNYIKSVEEIISFDYLKLAYGLSS